MDRPLDPDLVRLVEALAEAAALRDHRAATATDTTGTIVTGHEMPKPGA